MESRKQEKRSRPGQIRALERRRCQKIPAKMISNGQKRGQFYWHTLICAANLIFQILPTFGQEGADQIRTGFHWDSNVAGVNISKIKNFEAYQTNEM